MSSALPQHWDIFCRVVDNYGDIGVCWRLARQLAAEYHLTVRLWVDEPAAFQQICPAARWRDEGALYCGVQVLRWSEPWPDAKPTHAAQVVIEAFGCRLPDAYILAMSQPTRPPLWLNLEYLSAEHWVSGCHGLPSPQPSGLPKTFFFPGFTEDTGGLLRETQLLERRRAFQTEPLAATAFLHSLGVTPLDNALRVSLFCYDNPALPAWLEALTDSKVPCHLLIPAGIITAAVAAWLGTDSLQPGPLHRRGNLSVQALPFLRQEDYDRLLWCCDLNVVRGEDSFVRAQWAGRPFLWHIYPQPEQAHLPKLAAFLGRYSSTLAPAEASALMALWQSWNSGEPPPESEWLLSLCSSSLRGHAEQWCTELGQQKNLAEALVRFSRNWL